MVHIHTLKHVIVLLFITHVFIVQGQPQHENDKKTLDVNTDKIFRTLKIISMTIGGISLIISAFQALYANIVCSFNGKSNEELEEEISEEMEKEYTKGFGDGAIVILPFFGSILTSTCLIFLTMPLISGFMCGLIPIIYILSTLIALGYVLYVMKKKE